MVQKMLTITSGNSKVQKRKSGGKFKRLFQLESEKLYLHKPKNKQQTNNYTWKCQDYEGSEITSYLYLTSEPATCMVSRIFIMTHSSMSFRFDSPCCTPQVPLGWQIDMTQTVSLYRIWRIPSYKAQIFYQINLANLCPRGILFLLS